MDDINNHRNNEIGRGALLLTLFSAPIFSMISDHSLLIFHLSLQCMILAQALA